jgi:hypothetical protein
MSCSSCDQFDTTVELRSPGQLERFIRTIRDCVEATTLYYESFESDREFIGQIPFPLIPVNGPWPDIMCYHFSCPSCRATFLLEAETYHGAGGSWGPNASPSHHLLHPTAFGVR